MKCKYYDHGNCILACEDHKELKYCEECEEYYDCKDKACVGFGICTILTSPDDNRDDQ